MTNHHHSDKQALPGAFVRSFARAHRGASRARSGGLRGRLSLLLAAVALAFAASAQARVERLTVPCDDKLCLWERPVVSPVAGWAFDTTWSTRLRISVLTPVGSNFSDAPANMMAQAHERAGRLPLQEFIRTEVDRLIGPSMSVSATPTQSLQTHARRKFETLRIAPRDQREGRVQTLAYAEQGDYFIVFTLNSTTLAEHKRAMPAFVKFVRNYSD